MPDIRLREEPERDHPELPYVGAEPILHSATGNL